MSPFKIAVVGIFTFFAVIGVFIFASYGGAEKKAIPEVTIWGTLPANYFADFVRTINNGGTIINAKYEQILPEDFEKTFVNALAEGAGPDIVLLPDNLLYQERKKLIPIGYQTYPERDFRDTFVDASQLFVSKQGILGVPFTIDPLVMYWNRDMFASAGVSRPPQYWSELEDLAPRMIERNETLSVLRAMVPFGEVRNVKNAKEIIATLLFQAGSSIVVEGDTGVFYSTIDVSPASTVTAPANTAVNFYAAFSNPVNPIYTWNRSLPSSDEMFLAGDLAMYFGFSSELKELRSKNPNLNFDVATMPQAENTIKTSYGRIYALSIVKGAKDVNSALTALGILTSPTALETWTTISKMPPVRRDLLTARPADAFLDVFYSAAIQSRTWMDPNPEVSNLIFRDMVESVTTGRTGSNSDVVTLAKQLLDQALKDNQ